MVGEAVDEEGEGEEGEDEAVDVGFKDFTCTADLRCAFARSRSLAATFTVAKAETWEHSSTSLQGYTREKLRGCI